MAGAKEGAKRPLGTTRWRELGRRLREHDWLPVGIEFVILIAGVFLGLQANNWNQDREERKRAQAYLARLHDDLSASIADQDAATAFFAQAYGYAVQALDHAENGRLVEGSAWKTLLAYYQGGQYYGYHLPDGTFREMSSAGDMRLLNDSRLSAALGGFYLSHADNEARMFGLLPRYRETIRGIVPSGVQRHIWDHCYRQVSISRQSMIDCPPGLSEAESVKVLAAILANREAVGELRFWLTQMRVNSNVIAAERKTAREVLAQVDRARN